MTFNQSASFLLLVLLTVKAWGCSPTQEVTEKGAPSSEGIKVHVTSEYSPSRIVVKKNQAVKLVFYRDDDSECTSQVDFEDFDIKKDLVAHQNTTIELKPETTGEFPFVCGMGMMKGTLVVLE